MKKIILQSIFLFAFTFLAINLNAQTVNKEQSVKEINELFQSVKLWDYEGIAMDNGGSLKYHICLNPECNPFVSWDFFIKNLKSIELGRFEEYDAILFTCPDSDCIIPTGYEKGGRYDMKKELAFLIKDKKKASELVKKLNAMKGLF